MKTATLMKKVEIHFPSILQLWEFGTLITFRSFKASLVKHCLICQCTEAEIELATSFYHAEVKQLDKEDEEPL